MRDTYELSCRNNNAFVVDDLPLESSSITRVGQKTNNHLQLIWKDLSYSVRVRGIPCLRSGETKHILSSVSGHLTSGSLTALMGPSGAGKTTLLNCIAGKINSGLKGSISLRFPGKEQEIRIGFVPQREHMLMQFTVTESVMFASRLNNPSFSSKEHHQRVQETLQSLDILTIGDSKLSKISGGQLKRTSIALELVSFPQILMLDEPTTGLDSDNSESVVTLLKSLTSGSLAPAVVATIHQPSTDAFLMFDQIYLLNRHGSNMYFGPPAHVMDHMASFGFERKTYVNPAEYMIEIANAKYGEQCFNDMTDKASLMYKKQRLPAGNDVPVASLRMRTETSGVFQFWALLWRSLIAYTVKSKVILFRVAISTIFSLMMSLLFQEPIGKRSGCWKDLMSVPDNMTEEEWIRRSFFGSNDSSDVNLKFDLNDQTKEVGGATMFLYVLAMFQMFMTAFAVITVYPSVMATNMREISNHWYRVTAYFFSLIVSEALVVFSGVLPAVATAYFLSQFPNDWQRFALMFAAVYLLALTWGSRGLFFTILCEPYTIIAFLVTMFLYFQTVFVSGLVVMIQQMKPFFQMISHMSDLKFGFKILISAAFGLGRCSGGETTSSIINHVMKKKSMIRLGASFWPLFNITSADFTYLAKVLGLEDNYLDPLPYYLADFLGGHEEQEEDEEHEPSFMMDHFEIKESDVLPSFCFLIAAVVSAWLLIFIAIVIRTRSIKL